MAQRLSPTFVEEPWREHLQMPKLGADRRLAQLPQNIINETVR